MLAISPLRSSNGEGVGEGSDFEEFQPPSNFDVHDFSDGLLEDIDFDFDFVGFADGDFLPELEVDPAEIMAEFSRCEAAAGAANTADVQEKVSPEAETSEEKAVVSESMEKDATSGVAPSSSSSSSEAERGRKQMAKRSKSKRKVKVDWTPELHRRFVEAVEKLGVEKAVPSRILEIMGIDCLTRHNIASHLQKYRSHRKHLLAREAEAASWTQRRQIYAAAGNGAAAKREVGHPWLAQTIGFPPPPPPVPPFRPLHVWGHPTVDRQMMHVWPKHLIRSPPPPPWIPPLLPQQQAHPSYWQPHYPRVTQGTPCFTQPSTAATQYPAPPVSGVPPHHLYRPHCGVPPSSKPSAPQLQLQVHPSKESIDAIIGDVLGKPWLPLPLGLKPPSTESVLVELQRQGIPKIPPTCG